MFINALILRFLYIAIFNISYIRILNIEIIKKFLGFVNNEVEFDPEHPQEHTDLWNELCEKAEQFISEVVKND